VDGPQTQPKPKSLRTAIALNFILPGSGQWYLGQRTFGGVLVLTFLICFVAMLIIFLRGYTEYMRLVTSNDIFESNLLEQLGTVFHIGWLLGFLVGSIIVFVIAMAGLMVLPKKLNTGKNG